MQRPAAIMHRLLGAMLAVALTGLAPLMVRYLPTCSIATMPDFKGILWFAMICGSVQWPHAHALHRIWRPDWLWVVV